MAGLKQTLPHVCTECHLMLSVCDVSTGVELIACSEDMELWTALVSAIPCRGARRMLLLAGKMLMEQTLLTVA